jgi:hypothetical protein
MEIIKLLKAENFKEIEKDICKKSIKILYLFLEYILKF